MNEEEMLKILNKEKSYTEEDLLLFIYDLRKENKQLQQELTDYKERNEKAIDLLDGLKHLDRYLDPNKPFIQLESENLAYYLREKEVLGILKKKDDIVTISRDMTHFFDGVAELDTTPLLSSEEILKIIKEEERNRKNVDNTHI